METTRQNKIARLLQKELSDIFHLALSLFYKKCIWTSADGKER